MNPRTRVFNTEEDLQRHVIEFLKEAFSLESETGATRGLMLSGGTTPLAVYEAISRKPVRADESLRLFLSDERMVPYDSTQSNAGNLQPMLEKIKLKPEQMLQVNTALGAEEAAQEFHHDLARELELGMNIETGLLGLGADGHTAGLFSNKTASNQTETYALSVNRADGLQGVTVSPALLKRVKKIVFIVAGDSKMDMLQTLLNDPLSIPAGIALQGHADVEIWTDLDIASEDA